MEPEILIVGQGLAGTLLAWELERAGVDFDLVDAGHRWAASGVATAIVSPITGQRLMKSWRVDTMLPMARDVYTGLEQELGMPLWREMRVRRFYVNEEERRRLAEKQADGLHDYTSRHDGEGFWIEGAARVDVPRLIAAMRERWLRRGRLREAGVGRGEVEERYSLVIGCQGAALWSKRGEPARVADGLTEDAFDFVRWQFSKGESLVGTIKGLSADMMLNRHHWMLPLEPGRALVGSTHVPARCDTVLTAEGRSQLEASAASMSREPFAPEAHRAGVRVAVPDRKPVLGRHPLDPRWGIFNGLGAKGALLAPGLARQWVRHVTERQPFDPEVDVGRLWRGAAAPQTVRGRRAQPA